MFMLAACSAGVLLEHPASPVRQVITSSFMRNALAGLAMGLTAVLLIYSPWGKRSGAHMNPAVTLSFLRLGKVRPWDALFYICAQFVGGAIAVGTAAVVFGAALGEPHVNYVVTTPGPRGVPVAFAAELLISALLMSMVLNTASRTRFERYTGAFAGALVALYITLEAPLSGMSMNVARTFASAVWARQWTAFWLYLIAPLAGMLLAAEFHLRRRAASGCAKYHHANSQRCIFCGANGGF
jgi:aquaporin Z